MKQWESIFRRTVRLFLEQRLPRSAAGLSYFLTLAFFPTLICLYTMLGRSFPAAYQIREFLTGLMPQETVATITEYLRYVSGNISTPMLTAAVLVMAMASSAAFRLIDGTMKSLRGEKHLTDLPGVLYSFFFSLIFLSAIWLAVLLIVTGKWFLDAADRHIMAVNLAPAWSWARFALLFLLLFVILAGVYRITAPRGRSIRILPGALVASLTIVGSGVLFSCFISFTVRELVYGSLASMIIMMFWLYVCGLLLFAGGALNTAIEQER